MRKLQTEFYEKITFLAVEIFYLLLVKKYEKLLINIYRKNLEVF